MKIKREFFHKLHTMYQEIVVKAGVKSVADGCRYENRTTDKYPKAEYIPDLRELDLLLDEEEEEADPEEKELFNSLFFLEEDESDEDDFLPVF